MESKKWYAMLIDDEDNDWGTGFSTLEEAKAKLIASEGYYKYIAVIDEGDDPICEQLLTVDDI